MRKRLMRDAGVLAAIAFAVAVLGVFAVAEARAARWQTCVGETCTFVAFVGRGVEGEWASAQVFPRGTILRLGVRVAGRRVPLGTFGGERCAPGRMVEGVIVKLDVCRGVEGRFRVRLNAENRAGVDRRVTVSFRVLGGVL